MSYLAASLGLPLGSIASAAAACSNDGIVAGLVENSDFSLSAIVWDASNSPHLLPGLGATTPSDGATGLTADGSIAIGYSRNASGARHAVYWTGGPSWTSPVVHDLGILGVSPANESYALGCSSDASLIVGFSQISGSLSTSACIWSAFGAPTAIPPGPTRTFALASSPDGSRIVGGTNSILGAVTPASSWTGGPSWALTALGDIAGSVGPSGAAGCTNSGFTVGWASDSSGNTFAGSWTGTTLTQFPGPAGGSGSQAFGVDPTGVYIVGTSSSGEATLWVSGTSQSLPLFPDAASVADATAISPDLSTIAGNGTDGSGNAVAVKWSLSRAPLIWFRLNTGAWFPSGDPTLQTGGISLSDLAGSTLYPTVQGTGDAGITLNAGNAAFVGTVPTGYTAGLPHSGGGFTTLDPAKNLGSASLSGGDRTASFIASPGMAQTVDGYTSGQYYFELSDPTGDIFSADWGGGVGVDYHSSGGNFNNWINNGALNGSSNLGGALVGGQTLVHALSSLFSLGTTIQSDVFDFDKNAGNVVGVALFISPGIKTTTIADLFFSPTPSFIDFTEPANRRKFIAVNGGAQNLQADGSGPFAVSPPVFLSLQNADPPNNFALNRGRGGPFQISGPVLTDGGSNPPEVTVTTQSAATTVPFSAVLGDYLTGNIYAFNPDTLTDNGTQRKWLRRWRALPGETNSAITFSYLAIDMETGIGVPPGTNPQLVLRWSDDGGHTWSAERIIPVGATGATSFVVKFNRLGSTKRFGGSTRIFELSSTDPFKVSIIDAEVLTK